MENAKVEGQPKSKPVDCIMCRFSGAFVASINLIHVIV